MHNKEALHKAEVEVSDILESHGIPDPYKWRFNSLGQVIPENSDIPIENIIYQNNPIEKSEYQAFLKIQEHAFKINSGFIFWISPRHPVYYPDTSKIIISKKEGNLLLNWSINTDWDILGSILAAQELATLSDLDPNIFKSSLDVRANPIFVKKEKEDFLWIAIEKMLKPESFEMMITGKDAEIKKRFMQELLAGQDISLGSNPRSCPTLFEIFSGEKKILCCTCPFCGQRVEAEIHNGKIHCPNCQKAVDWLDQN
jgi:hypothetical protein